MDFKFTFTILDFWFIQEEGTYKGKKFNAICHFFGYQARGALPSKFDCDYAYVNSTSLLYLMIHLVILLNDLLVVWFQVLGHVCYHILAAGLNGYMATVTNLKNHLVRWKCGAAPITVSIAFISTISR